jgi:hypothetical protein
MANNIPAGNLDFTSPIEAMNALQRNPQVARFSLAGILTSTFTASTLYGVLIDSGSVTLTAGSSGGAFLVKLSGPSVASFPFGAPLSAPPPGGAVVATVSASTVNCSIFYK